jgi:hypothetical protein
VLPGSRGSTKPPAGFDCAGGIGGTAGALGCGAGFGSEIADGGTENVLVGGAVCACAAVAAISHAAGSRQGISREIEGKDMMVRSLPGRWNRCGSRFSRAKTQANGCAGVLLPIVASAR